MVRASRAARCSLLLVAVLTPFGLAAAEEAAGAPVLEAGTKGLEFALPASGTPDLSFSYFIMPSGALRFDLSLQLQFNNAAGGTTADIGIGVGYRGYLAPAGRLYPFFQPQIMFGRLSAPSSGYFMLGAGFGVEYFFTDRFSVGGELALAANFTNIGAPAGTSVSVGINTGTSNLFAGFKW